MASIVKKLLIANRGEIALRVVRTAKEMGISTVAVYSEQDCNSRYVDMADEAYLLSGDTYKDTYLNEDLLIDILHKTGADAVHPGYGFLSEVCRASRRRSRMPVPSGWARTTPRWWIWATRLPPAAWPYAPKCRQCPACPNR